MANVLIKQVGGLKNGASRKFQFTRDGVSFEGFVVRVSGDYFVYENRCMHLPLPLDYGDNHFFTPDGKHLVCTSHGAMYEPSTGTCIQGPCAGARLKRLPFRVADDDLIVEPEESDVDGG